MPINYKLVSVRLPMGEYREWQAAAATEKRSINSLVRVAVDLYIQGLLLPRDRQGENIELDDPKFRLR